MQRFSSGIQSSHLHTPETTPLRKRENDSFASPEAPLLWNRPLQPATSGLHATYSPSVTASTSHFADLDPSSFRRRRRYNSGHGARFWIPWIMKGILVSPFVFVFLFLLFNSLRHSNNETVENNSYGIPRVLQQKHPDHKILHPFLAGRHQKQDPHQHPDKAIPVYIPMGQQQQQQGASAAVTEQQLQQNIVQLQQQQQQNSGFQQQQQQQQAPQYMMPQSQAKRNFMKETQPEQLQQAQSQMMMPLQQAQPQFLTGQNMMQLTQQQQQMYQQQAQQPNMMQQQQADQNDAVAQAQPQMQMQQQLVQPQLLTQGQQQPQLMQQQQPQMQLQPQQQQQAESQPIMMYPRGGNHQKNQKPAHPSKWNMLKGGGRKQAKPHKQQLTAPPQGSTQPMILYYDPAQAIVQGQLQAPSVVYDEHGNEIELASLVTSGMTELFIEPPLVAKFPMFGSTESDNNGGNRRMMMMASSDGSTTSTPSPLEMKIKAPEKWGQSSAQDQSIIVCTVAVMALLVGALSARRLRARSFLSSCIENESLEDEAAFDSAYTVTGGDSYNTFGWKGDLEKFDV